MPRDFDDRELLKFEVALRRGKKSAIPFAIQRTLNRGVVDARDNAKAFVRREFVVRRPWVVNSIRSQGTTTLRIHAMRAMVGTIGPELVRQEFGKRLPHQVLPTSTASGEGKVARPRRRTPKRGWASRDIELDKSAKKNANAKSTGQAAMVRVKQALKRKEKFIYLDLGKTKGIFRPTKKGLRAVAIFHQKPVVLRPRPWLHPTVEKTKTRMPSMYFSELAVQLRRAGLRS